MWILLLEGMSGPADVPFAGAESTILLDFSSAILASIMIYILNDLLVKTCPVTRLFSTMPSFGVIIDFTLSRPEPFLVHTTSKNRLPYHG